MGKAKELSEGTRRQVFALSNERLSHRKIAEKLRISKGGVQRTLDRFRETKSFSTKPRVGRPKCTTLREDKYIKVTSFRNRTLTAGDIQAQINETREKPISKRTVRRRLATSNLNERVATSKPLLRLPNKRKRMSWARKYKHYTREDWKKVIFPDESKFKIHGNNRRIYITRRKNERLINSCIKSTVKQGGGSIQGWGCFGHAGVGDLYRINGTLTKEKYH